MEAFTTEGGQAKSLQIGILARFMDHKELEDILMQYEKAKLIKHRNWTPTVEDIKVVEQLLADEIGIEEAGKQIGYKQVVKVMKYLKAKGVSNEQGSDSTSA